MNENMTEQAEKHFNGRLWSVLILSVLMICAGIYWAGAGLEKWKLEGKITISGSGAFLLFGICGVLLGIWGLCFSRKRNQKIPKHAVVLWASTDFLVMGWFLETVFLICAGLYFMFRDRAGSDIKYGFLMYALIAAPFAFLSFYVYRKKCLLLYDGQIEYTGFLKTKRYSVLDVKQIRIMKQKNRYGSEFITGYSFLGEDGKALFTAGKSMVHVQEFMNQFSELYRQAAMEHLTDRQKEEQKQKKKRIEERSEPEAPVEAVKKAKVISWILFFADLIAGVLLTVLHSCTSVMAGWQYCILMNLLPLNYLVYIWVYADLIGDGRWEDDEWMKRHVSVEMRWGILILQNLLSVLQGLMVSMQCVRGADRVFWTGFAIFVVLSIVSVRRLGLKKHKKEMLLLTVILTGVLCESLTLSLFLAAAGPQRHRSVEVTRVTQSGGKFNSWYAFILQENGNETRLRVDNFTYRRLERGGEAFLHKYNSLFDTEFVYLGANPPE